MAHPVVMFPLNGHRLLTMSNASFLTNVVIGVVPIFWKGDVEIFFLIENDEVFFTCIQGLYLSGFLSSPIGRYPYGGYYIFEKPLPDYGVTIIF